jgi:hypothetical protein
MNFPQRAIAAARLEVPAFEEIEADRQATSQALVVVVVSNVAAGIGLTSSFYHTPVADRVMLALLLWVFWATATYVVGVYLMPEPQTKADVGELLRTIGFASSPGILRIFGFIPALGEVIYGVSSAWMFVAMVVAVRQALDYKSTGRALVVCLITWIVAVLLTAMVGGLLFLFLEEVVS